MKSRDVRILVVDDDHRTSTYLAQILALEGWDVDTASGGVNALKLVARERYDAILLDYRMPGMDGAELCRRIHDIQPSAREVFLTGFPTIDTVYPAFQAGGQRVLSKPVDPKELVRVMEEQLALAAAGHSGEGENFAPTVGD